MLVLRNGHYPLAPHLTHTTNLRCSSRSKVIIVILTGEGHGGGLVHLLPVLLEKSLVNLGGRGGERWRGDEFLHNESVATVANKHSI